MEHRGLLCGAHAFDKKTNLKQLSLGRILPHRAMTIPNRSLERCVTVLTAPGVSTHGADPTKIIDNNFIDPRDYHVHIAT